ncbi:MAG: tetratricopeptide repeat-containing serine/threonine protein kinase [Phycisphaerales bacterium]|nr:tetratricopeptide repeat-containing serine/threonine protein kinase [Phycisphaerales bacterium]
MNKGPRTDPDVFSRVKTLFQRALSLRPGEREAFLTKCEEASPELVAEVRRLLKASPPTDFLEPVAGAVIDRIIDPSPQELIGQDVGAYRIERWIDAGGMGDVYIARRTDTRLERKVAIKVLRRSLFTSTFFERMQEERELLERLHHPNIVKLCDTGMTTDGLPFLVMEYIEGRPITEYCDKKSLTITKRLELFCEVCDAVHYAHQNLIVHRDLKPTNILVTTDGVVKLLDFGIAKLAAFGQPASDSSTVATAMTPQYASPEQLAGDLITTASDVYSLGTILFELLTGALAHPPASREPEMDLGVSTRERLPSRRIGSHEEPDWVRIAARRSMTTRRLARKLRGDLDDIVTMALQVDPSARYRSVQQMSCDLQRHLRNQPVTARRLTLGYRISKFARRNRIATFASCLALGSMIFATAAIGVALIQTRTERDQAQSARVQTQETLSFLSKLLSEPKLRDSDAGAHVMDVLQIAEDQLAANPPEDLAVEAMIRTTMGKAMLNLARCEDAKRQFDRVLEIRQNEIDDSMVETANSLVCLCESQQCLGDFLSAEASARRALALYRAAQSENSYDVALGLNNLAVVLQRTNRHSESEPLLREAIRISESNSKCSELLPVIRNSLAMALYARGADEEAHRLLESALEDALQDQKHVPTIGIAWNNYAKLLSLRGRFVEAFDYLKRAYKLQRQEFGPWHPEVARTLNNQGYILYTTGNNSGAEEAFSESIEILRRTLGEEHIEYARGMYNLARVLRTKKALDESERCLRKAAEIYEKKLGAENPFLISILTNLGSVLLDQREYEEATVPLRRAVSMIRGEVPAKEQHVSNSMILLGLALIGNREFVEAESHLYESIRFLEEHYGKENPSTLDARSVLGLCMARAGRCSEGCEVMLNSHERVVKVVGSDHPISLSIEKRITLCNATK